MIFTALEILARKLEDYLSNTQPFDNADGEIVALQNIAKWDALEDIGSKMKDKIIISLIRIDEETTLKNAPHFRLSNKNDEEGIYKNPPIHLNLFILITANFDDYQWALTGLSKTIEFFQGQKAFQSEQEENKKIDLNVELCSPGFNELQNIWSMLGGKQMPSALYKVQLVQMDRSWSLDTGKVINKEIDYTFYKKGKGDIKQNDKEQKDAKISENKDKVKIRVHEKSNK